MCRLAQGAWKEVPENQHKYEIPKKQRKTDHKEHIYFLMWGDFLFLFLGVGGVERFDVQCCIMKNGDQIVG